MPGLLPGARKPPDWMVVAPLIVPLPPRLAPEATVTAPVPVPEPVVLLINKMPALTVVVPL